MKKDLKILALFVVLFMSVVATIMVSASSVKTETSKQVAPTQTTVTTTTVDLETEKERREREDNIDLLARVITVEMGANWASDGVQLMVGSVVLNRVSSNVYPDTLREVVYQRGQYPSAHNGVLDRCVPTEQALKNAAFLLDNGSVLPDNVLFQAEFKQGNGVYMIYKDPVIHTNTYFCFL